MPSPRRGSSWLVNSFFDESLWSVIITWLSPADIVLFGRVCKAVAESCAASSWATWWCKARWQRLTGTCPALKPHRANATREWSVGTPAPRGHVGMPHRLLGVTWACLTGS